MQKILLFSHLFVSSEWKLLAKGAMTKRCFVLTFVAAGPDVMKNANPGMPGYVCAFCGRLAAGCGALNPTPHLNRNASFRD